MTTLAETHSAFEAGRPTAPFRDVRFGPVDIEVTEPYPLLLNDLTNIYIFNAKWLTDNNASLPTDSGKGVEGWVSNPAQEMCNGYALAMCWLAA